MGTHDRQHVCGLHVNREQSPKGKLPGTLLQINEVQFILECSLKDWFFVTAKV